VFLTTEKLAVFSVPESKYIYVFKTEVTTWRQGEMSFPSWWWLSICRERQELTRVGYYNRVYTSLMEHCLYVVDTGMGCWELTKLRFTGSLISICCHFKLNLCLMSIWKSFCTSRTIFVKQCTYGQNICSFNLKTNMDKIKFMAILQTHISALSDFLRSSGSGRGPTQPRDNNWKAISRK
jgi:hypothetical protein